MQTSKQTIFLSPDVLSNAKLLIGFRIFFQRLRRRPNLAFYLALTNTTIVFSAETYIVVQKDSTYLNVHELQRVFDLNPFLIFLH
jgi:hypothetical protein